MKKKQLKVIYKEYGLGNHFNDHIEINKKLKYNKPLRDYIVKHELTHSNKFDLKHEFQLDWKIIPLLILFVIKNKSTWVDFLPIQIRNKKIVYDLNLIILYIFLIVLLIINIKIFF